MKKPENNGTTTLSKQKKDLISKIQFYILIELTIHGSLMILLPIVTQHHSFSPKIHRKNSDIQIDLVQIFSRFNRIRRYFRIDVAMTTKCHCMKNNLIYSLSKISTFINVIVPDTIQLVTNEKFHSYSKVFTLTHKDL